MKKRSLVFSALAALATAGVLAGCGSTYYFAGRTLPPSGIANRVLIAVQNPSVASQGLLTFVDAYYDIRQNYKDTIPSFSISGYSGKLPVTIQNMPEEQIGAVYGSGDGSFNLVNYAKEANIGSKLTALSSSIFISRAETFIIAANQQANVVTVVDEVGGKQYSLGLPGVNHVAMNPGGTVMMAFVQNSNYAYYPRKLTSADSTSLAAYYTANQSWPAPYVDCEPKNLPGMCLAQVQDPSGNALTFDRPVKAIFGADGSSMYILNCGPECGGTTASVTVLPVAPFNVNDGQQSGTIPTQSAMTKYLTPGGASNALETPGLGVSSASATAGSSDDILYVLGQGLSSSGDGLFTGSLTPIDLTTGAVGSPISVSDSAPGSRTRMIVADDNTLWLGGVRCTEGERYATGQAYGCLTMFNTTTNTVSLIEPFQGDLTGIAAVTTLHKIYIAEGGQVYIYKTTDGTAINNFFVTVTGTAYDVAYMDGTSDANNTVY